MKHLLLDIEGTTTPISFVYDQLFPYAKANLRTFLTEHAADDAVRELVDMLDADARLEEQHDLDCPRVRPAASAAERAQDAAEIAETLMARDRKATGLKALQGHVWRAGYETGQLKGQVYDDVPPVLDRMLAAGVGISIYSSGSVAAQKLLFGFSDQGDLTSKFTAYFDTTTGPKKEAESYRRIASTLGHEVHEITFCTDNLDEAKAGDAAGMSVYLSVRPGNPPLSKHRFQEVRNFRELESLATDGDD